MHEMALVRNVVDIVVEQAEKSGAEEVKTVYLTIGPGRDVVIDYLDGFIFPINVFKQETWVCPSCKAEKDYKLNSGMEFMINRIEVKGHKPPQVEQAEETSTPATGQEAAATE